jgi:hypothetical protein
MKREEVYFPDLELLMDAQYRERERERSDRHRDEKRACRMFFQDGMMAEEIAGALRVPLTTVRGILCRWKRVIADE